MVNFKILHKAELFSGLVMPFHALFPFCFPDSIVTVCKGNAWMETRLYRDRERENREKTRDEEAKGEGKGLVVFILAAC